MNRTLRTLALPAIAAVLLAGCGSSAPSDEPTVADAPAAKEAPDASEAPAASDGDESDSWPIVEDEDGNVVENPEDEPGESDGGDDDPWKLAAEPFVASTAAGALITMNMDAQHEDSEEIAWMEQYRQDVGADEVTYILSDVDNRDGSDSVNMYDISVFDMEGKAYECGIPDSFVNDNWKPVWLYLASDDDSYTTADGEPMEYDKGEELSRSATEHEFTTGVSPFERNSLVSICPDGLPEEAVAVQVMPSGISAEPTYATPESYMGEDG